VRGAGGAADASPLDTLAAVYRRQGRYTDALDALEEAERIAPVGHDALHEHLAESRRDILAAMSSTGATSPSRTMVPGAL